jgi:hypothetical protein
MKVTRILATSLLLAVGVLAAGNAYADGALRLSWLPAGATTCDYVQNTDFTGPGQMPELVVSLSGETRATRGHRVQVSIGPNVQDAWRFDALTLGCNKDQAIAYSNAGVNKTNCPAAQGGVPIPINQYLYDQATGKALLDWSLAHDPVTYNPAVRYTLARAKFDHTYSNVGPTDPSYCGGAEGSLCFHIVLAEHVNDLFQKSTYGLDEFWVTWQDVGNTLGCPGPTQAEQTTWGRVKGLYR